MLLMWIGLNDLGSSTELKLQSSRRKEGGKENMSTSMSWHNLDQRHETKAAQSIFRTQSAVGILEEFRLVCRTSLILQAPPVSIVRSVSDGVGRWLDPRIGRILLK